MSDEQLDALTRQVTIGVTTQELVFYTSCFAFACLGSLSTTLRDDNYNRFSSLFGLCGCSGITAVFVVSMLAGRNGAAYGYEFYYVFLSGIIGLFGKFQDRIQIYILYGLLTKVENFFGFRAGDYERLLEETEHGTEQQYVEESRPDMEDEKG